MERGMSRGFDATVVTGERRAVPLEVSFKTASVALFILVLHSWLVRRVPVVTSRVGFLERIIPMFEFVEAICVRVLEVRESFEEILSEFPVAGDGDRSRSDSLRWYNRSCSWYHWDVLGRRGLSTVFLLVGELIVLLESSYKIGRGLMKVSLLD